MQANGGEAGKVGEASESGEGMQTNGREGEEVSEASNGREGKEADGREGGEMSEVGQGRQRKHQRQAEETAELAEGAKRGREGEGEEGEKHDGRGEDGSSELPTFTAAGEEYEEVGWHVGPCFACELPLPPSAVRQAFSWGASRPWLRLERCEQQADTLAKELPLCWRQMGLEALLRRTRNLIHNLTLRLPLPLMALEALKQKIARTRNLALILTLTMTLPVPLPLMALVALLRRMLIRTRNRVLTLT